MAYSVTPIPTSFRIVNDTFRTPVKQFGNKKYSKSDSSRVCPRGEGGKEAAEGDATPPGGRSADTCYVLGTLDLNDSLLGGNASRVPRDG